MRLKTLTLGCSKNRIDTEHLVAQCQDLYEIVPEDSPEDCDILLLNTCGFIGDAKQESIDAILQAVELKKAGHIGKIGVFGCLSQRYMDEMPGLIPEADAWFGARDTDPVLRWLGVEPDHEKIYGRTPTECGPGTAYLKISEGCDRRCSYCAIPFIRGAHKSVPMENLVREAAALASRGVKELILIAQDSTYYGLDLYKRRALGELIGKLSQIEGIEWIRIHYSYPASFPEDVLDAMADNPKVCKYLDIPLQHISDPVLDRMHRHVDGAWTRDLIKRLRERVPGVALRTTMIVGFPGETGEDFRELLDFVREARFERLGAFCYSEEEGTFGAENFPDDIPQELKEERYEALMSLQREISTEFNRSRIGSVLKVMVDGRMGDELICRSEFDSPEVDGEIIVRRGEADENAFEDICAGEFITVRIVDAGDYDLVGEIVK